ncbi:condensation domain-containing protein [Micromonospora sp. WMMD882]|uniref:condensation domain-containing protein n=1 Tax=Micromonospora sp. WMMD882 TaxID=3015151 RepID=UPI00248AE360|nr:condensation domain-containing protein [Micromonospora sp. WMMD882]WBB80562.1 condensation domain-containing protein [Micromonospora sp. WMMD882]
MLVSQPVDGTTEEMAYVDFHGGRAATGPLTWGQRAMWRAVTEFESTRHSLLNLRRTLPVSPRAQVPPRRALTAFAALLGRHESLRTRVRADGGDLRQVASAAGRLPVLVCTVPTADADPDGRAAARRLVERLGGPRFDHAGEWPLRAALVVVDGLVRQVVVVFSHSTVDFHATETVLRDLRLLLVRGVVPGPPGLQSLDVADRERQAERPRSARAVAYWLRQFRSLPPGAFAEPAGPAATPRYRRGALTSPAVHQAARLLAARHRTSSPTVLLAATAGVLGDRAGSTVCGVFTMANNRFQPAYDTAVSKLNQVGLCRIDVGPGRPGGGVGSFAELLANARRASLDGYRHAYYDPLELAGAFAEQGLDHGTALAPFCFFNDIRLPQEVPATVTEPASGELESARQASAFRWLEELERFAWRCRIQVVDAPGAVELVVTADTAYLPSDQAEQLLRDIEHRLVEAARTSPR